MHDLTLFARLRTASTRFARLRAMSARGAVNALLDMDATARQRRRLGRLDAHLRDDLGLSEAQIRAETARPLWDVPRWWR